MFRRTSKTSEKPGSTRVVDKDGGKGRPTPTRKEAQAAARERARAAVDNKAAKKNAQKVLRDNRGSSNAQIRAGIKNGDERFLPARDQGPVRRFIRDYVDSRLCIAELFLPILIIIMVMNYSGQEKLQNLSNGLWLASILLVLVDTVWLNVRLRRELRKRFPEETHKGTAFYAMLRVLQIRFMRMPKPKVKLGQQLPARY